jgi:hypothetical protein
VHQADAVRGGQALAGLQQRGEDVPPRARLDGQPGPQGHAVDQLHRHEHAAVGEPDVVHGDDVDVGEPRHRLGLALQAEPALADVAAGRPGVAQELDGDPAIELGVVGGEHHAHAALAERAEHEVAADRVAAADLRRRGETRPDDGVGRQGLVRIRRLALVTHLAGIIAAAM